MGMAELGTNALNWAKKIGDTVDTVLDVAQPFLDLYQKGNQIAQQFKNQAKPPQSYSDAAIAPGQVPTDSQLYATPPRTMSQSGGNLPLMAIGAGVVLLFLLKKK
jgi:hypothetical protein